MNTEQNYVGRGSHANNPEQTAQDATQNTPPFTDGQDQQEASLEAIPELSPIDFHTSPAGARQELDELIGRHLSEASAATDIEVINELFFFWLNKEYRKTTKEFGNHVTFNTLRITAFLMNLQEKWQTLKNREAHAAWVEKGGVNHG
ncbi:hypothetical protein GO730_00315 [Spirosoma sp. HMF3257]|uniref:Uncharacterized protein n=1 Tax=Spirosoma telluris TaxID=2183553 RepID=A0A327NDK2_9BACT|nr:hypothetical protein [Spirosoma telluris]RAI73247.1 hypothetical protein HMF3257_00305 [Spirosoma telluris]